MGFSIEWGDVYERAMRVHDSWLEMGNSSEHPNSYSFRFENGRVLRITRFSYGRNPVTAMNMLSEWIIEQHTIVALTA